MVVYEPMVLETHGITYRNPPAKNRHAINRQSLLNSRKNGKNEYVTKYVVEHVPQHVSAKIGVC
jgi:hypothetical protein